MEHNQNQCNAVSIANAAHVWGKRAAKHTVPWAPGLNFPLTNTIVLRAASGGTSSIVEQRRRLQNATFRRESAPGQNVWAVTVVCTLDMHHRLGGWVPNPNAWTGTTFMVKPLCNEMIHPSPREGFPKGSSSGHYGTVSRWRQLVRFASSIERAVSTGTHSGRQVLRRMKNGTQCALSCARCKVLLAGQIQRHARRLKSAAVLLQCQTSKSRAFSQESTLVI